MVKIMSRINYDNQRVMKVMEQHYDNPNLAEMLSTKFDISRREAENLISIWKKNMSANAYEEVKQPPFCFFHRICLQPLPRFAEPSPFKSM